MIDVRTLLPLALAASFCGWGAATNPGVIASFRKTNPRLSDFRTFVRHPLAGGDVLLVVRASEVRRLDRRTRWMFWSRGDILGVFLEDGRNPARVRELGLLPGKEIDYALTLDRADENSIVFSRTQSDYGLGAPSLKIFFDSGARRLTKVIEYAPVSIPSLLEQAGRLCFLAGDGTALRPYCLDEQGPVPVWGAEANRLLARAPEKPPIPGREVELEYLPFDGRFAVARPKAPQQYTAAAGVAERTGTGYRLFPLPPSTCAEFRRARPRRVKDGYCAGGDPEFHSGIGQYQIFERQFWFGKAFYDGEGLTGIGAIGYFDTGARKYVQFSPPGLADWSVSALLVETATVWAGMVRYPEGGEIPGGLLRYDRAGGRAETLDIPAIVFSLARHGDAVYAGTSNGLWAASPSGLRRWVIEPSASGRLQVYAAGPKP